MRSSILKTTLSSAALVLAVLLHGGIAHAEADSFGLGSGHDGALTVATAGTVINAYAQVTAAVTAGATSLTTANRTGTFAAGQVILLFQNRSNTALPSGNQASTALAGQTGRYEIARIAAVANGVLTLTHGTLNAFDANTTQVVTVPEYTTLDIAAGGGITAKAWDGATGGVLAFLATSAVTNVGTIDAAGTGFRGGIPITNSSNNGAMIGCTANDGQPSAGGTAAGGAHKGESVDATAFSLDAAYSATAHLFGRGNVSTGGGGGDCFNSGGGGGGHGATGGRGGNTNAGQDDNNNSNNAGRAVGGLGGGPITYDPATNLSFGGGGGAGDDDDGLAGGGGAGGGVVWMRAGSLAGTGTIVANGGNGTSSGRNGNFSDGAAGGGAGGGVFAWLSGNATCGGISAGGGAGGTSVGGGGQDYGPGGGGGGGRVRVASSGGTCNAAVDGGQRGTTTGGAAYGARGGATGDAATSGAFTSTTCTTGSGSCGGCVTDSFCAVATPVCNTAPGATQYTCIPGSTTPAPFGDPPAGGAACTAAGTPTQGASSGCTVGLCDTSDDKCGYAQGTACTGNEQCRSNLCGADGRCAAGAAGVDCTTDAGCTPACAAANKCKTGADGGVTGTSSSNIASLQGGGLGCSSAPGADAQTGWLAALGAFGFLAVLGRRRKKA